MVFVSFTALCLLKRINGGTLFTVPANGKILISFLAGGCLSKSKEVSRSNGIVRRLFRQAGQSNWKVTKGRD